MATGEATKRTAKPRAEKFSQTGDGDKADRQRQQKRIRQYFEIGAKPGKPEKHRHKQGDDQAAQLFVNMARQNWRLPYQNAGDEGPKHGVNADRMGDQRHRRHHQQNGCYDGHVTDKIIVHKTYQRGHHAPAKRETDCKEQCHACDAPGQ